MRSYTGYTTGWGGGGSDWPMTLGEILDNKVMLVVLCSLQIISSHRNHFVLRLSVRPFVFLSARYSRVHVQFLN